MKNRLEEEARKVVTSSLAFSYRSSCVIHTCGSIILRVYRLVGATFSRGKVNVCGG
jgi:hypothetical protein